ncbi:MAG TPA: hypothetical protein VL463_22495 [Kofleriaceae bacterium]|nr:hypothetical protein [Kofleriaceae bacterium]
MKYAVVLAILTSAAHAAPSFPDDVAKHAYPLAVQKGALAGKGADVLRPALDDATFVLIGEDHGIAQVPELAGALCTELAPHGFHRVALEVGPSVAPPLAQMAAAKDGAAQLRAFVAKYPETIAFYSWREDFAFVSSCAKQMKGFEIWGVDQELMGAAQLVFDQILAMKPGDDAAKVIQALLDEAKTDRKAAVKAADFGKLFLIAAAQATLDDAAAKLTGAPHASFDTLLRSRAIYQGQMSSDRDGPYQSNRDRALLMKEQFFGALSSAASKDKAMPKVLVKLGAWHLYRGLNPLHSSELGNLIAEAADAHQVKAVNVLVLGVTGTQLAAQSPGVDKPVPLDLRAKDSPYAFLTPFFDAQQKNATTLFDLRALRPHFDAYGALDKEMERLVFGYDFLVLIAAPKPEHAL